MEHSQIASFPFFFSQPGPQDFLGTLAKLQN